MSLSACGTNGATCSTCTGPGVCYNMSCATGGCTGDFLAGTTCTSGGASGICAFGTCCTGCQGSAVRHRWFLPVVSALCALYSVWKNRVRLSIEYGYRYHCAEPPVSVQP
jgi:hypothetical protein